ncbi:MAG: SGNH/GDSL hydrolase family protein, partial [Bacteroidota bacterium]
MRAFSLLLVCFFAVSPLLAQPCWSSQSLHIVVLGSSTAAGAGASPVDSAWVWRYRHYLQSINPANQVSNLAVGGFTSYRIMPTGFVPPASRPSPDTTHNITTALTLAPDAIIINLPSNDVSSGYTVAEQL